MSDANFDQSISFLRSEPIGVVLSQKQPQKLVVVKDNDSVEDVLSIMNEHNLAAVPVVNSTKSNSSLKENDSPYFRGIINIMDLLIPIVFYASWGQTHVKGIEKDQFMARLKLEVLNSPVSDWLGISEEGDKGLLIVNCTRSIFDAMCQMVKTGRHRVLTQETHSSKLPIQSPSASPSHGESLSDVEIKEQPQRISDSVSVLSQTDVIRFIHDHQSQFTDVLSCTLEQLGLYNEEMKEKMVMASSEDSALVAFSELRQSFDYELQAIPIIDQHGHLAGNLSAADLRKLNRDNLHTLLLPVIDYLKVHGDQRVSSAFFVIVSPQDSLKDTIHKMITNNVHRAWIIDEACHCIGVVSFTDIIRLFTSKFQPEAEEEQRLKEEQRGHSSIIHDQYVC